MLDGLFEAAFGAEKLAPEDVVGGDAPDGEGQEARADEDHEERLPAFPQFAVLEDFESFCQAAAFAALADGEKVQVAHLGVNLSSVNKGGKVGQLLAGFVAVAAEEGLLLDQAVTLGLKFQVGISLAKKLSRVTKVDLVRQFEASTASVDQNKHHQVEGQEHDEPDEQRIAQQRIIRTLQRSILSIFLILSNKVGGEHCRRVAEGSCCECEKQRGSHQSIVLQQQILEINHKSNNKTQILACFEQHGRWHSIAFCSPCPFRKQSLYLQSRVGKMGTSMIVPQHVSNKMAHRGRINNKSPDKNLVLGQKKDEALQKLVNQLPQIVVPLQESKNKEEPKTEVTEAVASLPPNQQPLQNRQEKLHGQEKENFEENQLSIWKNLSKEGLSHFKKADNRRKQSIKAKSGLKKQNPAEKAQPNVSNDQANNHNTSSDVHSDRPNDFALSVHSKIKEAPQRKEEVFLKQAIKKRILLPSVEIVSSVKEKRKLKFLYNDAQVVPPQQK